MVAIPEFAAVTQTQILTLTQTLTLTLTLTLSLTQTLTQTLTRRAASLQEGGCQEGGRCRLAKTGGGRAGCE